MQSSFSDLSFTPGAKYSAVLNSYTLFAMALNVNVLHIIDRFVDYLWFEQQNE